ncbi:MAG: hypothetical protein R3316_01355 [Rhodovibrionaceae bacterium]|nr:hypothetical protein [Rhodovibrionaceae bacterium]
MSLQKIRLELARDHDYPQGSANHGYEFVAPLQRDGHIDPEAFKKSREKCRVWRFWRGQEDEHGHLVRTRGGTWAFHYDIDGDPDEDESGYRFDSHTFNPGDYVSVKEQDGSLKTFRVVQVRPLA